MRKIYYVSFQFIAVIAVGFIFLFIISNHMHLLEKINIENLWLYLFRAGLYIFAVFIVPFYLCKFQRIRNHEIKRLRVYIIVISIVYELIILSR